jgi:UDP-N-acetylglucosamine 2-epimerase (non-hydrolysing)
MENAIVACVVGARPNFVKIAPIMRAFIARGIGTRLIHTGQHYDTAMNAVFFDELRIPHPDIDLEVGSDSAARQIARIVLALDKVFEREPPALVLVVGDVNTTLAAALVASKRNIALAHVEAGLRSRDRTMPEEVNRVLTDAISDLLFTTEEEAIENLKREGIDPAKVHLVGNVMIDSLLAAVERAVPAGATLEAAGASAAFRNAAAKGFGLVTLHRPSNVDDPKRLREVLETLAEIAERLPLVFPLHPRTREAAKRAGLMPLLEGVRVFAGEPLGYLAIVGLMREAKVVITDSGGVQEETTALGVPCLTVRPNTERPITIEEGTNTLVGTDPVALLKAVDEVLAGGGRQGRVPRFWDGHAAERIADRVAEFLRSHRRNA